MRAASSTTRILLGSAMSGASQGALIDDGVGKVPHLEQGRYAAHGFGMTQTDETARQQIFIEVFGRHASGRIVEVDQHVPAKNHIEPAMRPRSSGLYDIRGRKFHGIAQIVEDLPAVIKRG